MPTEAGTGEHHAALASGETPKGPVGRAFSDEVGRVTASRERGRKARRADSDEMVASMHSMPKALKMLKNSGRRGG